MLMEPNLCSAILDSGFASSLSEYLRFKQELPFEAYTPVEYLVKWATLPWEEAEAYQLRRDVFCDEQGIFSEDDRDATDERAQLIIALACTAGIPDQVVGTVRIHEEAPGVWYGSRLAVDEDFRNQGKLGATLIKLAVTSANAIGCHTFLAHVQSQNVPLFRRLHWSILKEETILGRSHHLMQANLDKYPPFLTPQSGFVIKSKR
jgi:putative N-acetyltransferase (TIGR04045 family)